MMENYAAELITRLREKMPTADISWEKAPDPFFNKKSCILAAVNKNDSSKKTSMEFKDGLSNEHDIECVVDDFIAHCGPHLK